jgi:hypothetical protein
MPQQPLYDAPASGRPRDTIYDHANGPAQRGGSAEGNYALAGADAVEPEYDAAFGQEEPDYQLAKAVVGEEDDPTYAHASASFRGSKRPMGSTGYAAQPAAGGVPAYHVPAQRGQAAAQYDQALDAVGGIPVYAEALADRGRPSVRYHELAPAPGQGRADRVPAGRQPGGVGLPAATAGVAHSYDRAPGAATARVPSGKGGRVRGEVGPDDDDDDDDGEWASDPDYDNLSQLASSQPSRTPSARPGASSGPGAARYDAAAALSGAPEYMTPARGGGQPRYDAVLRDSGSRVAQYDLPTTAAGASHYADVGQPHDEETFSAFGSRPGSAPRSELHPRPLQRVISRRSSAHAAAAAPAARDSFAVEDPDGGYLALAGDEGL